MKVFYRELERVRDYFIEIDNCYYQLRTKETTGTTGATRATMDSVHVKSDKQPELHEIIPVYLDPFEQYNYVRISEEDVPKNLIPISWHELPLPVKQQIVQIEENEQIGVYDPQRPSILFTG